MLRDGKVGPTRSIFFNPCQRSIRMKTVTTPVAIQQRLLEQLKDQIELLRHVPQDEEEKRPLLSETIRNLAEAWKALQG